MKDNQYNDDLFNPKESRKLLRQICGLKLLQGTKRIKFINYLNIITVYIFLIVAIVQGLLFLNTESDISDKIEAMHYTLVLVIIIAYLSNELYNYYKLDEAWNILIYSYITYNNGSYGGDISEEQRDIHRYNSRLVKTLNGVFSTLMSVSCLAYLSFTPVRDLVNKEPDMPRALPIPLYFPYDTTKNPGYASALIWEGVLLFITATVATSAHQSYMAYFGALKAELKLLNYSICNIERRTMDMCKIKTLKKDAYEDQMFQGSLNACLRNDIIHHHKLLQYYRLTKSYLGFILLMFIVVASIILAAAGYLITSPSSPMDQKIKFVVIVSSEMTYISSLCWMGEQVSEESGLILHNFFGGPWYSCNKKFTNNIKIMLCETLKPLRLTTNMFNITASLETFNAVVTTAFQYFNVLRNFQHT